MRLETLTRNVVAGVTATLLLFGALECLIRGAYWVRSASVTAVPLPYVIGHDYGPVPPWLEGLLILAPDRDLIWKNRPNLTRRYVDIFRPVNSDGERLALFRRFSPRIPVGLDESASWDISINSEGFRDREISSRKPPSVFRIVCLGDSWTFGMNVSQDQAYPQRLSAALQQQFPRATFEVLNRGVLGYSSYQGAQLLRNRILDLDPDVVVIGYAMNDSKVVGYRDKDLATWEKHITFKEKTLRLVRTSQTYKLLQYMALILRHKPQSIGFHLKAAADAANNKVDDFAKLDPWTRVGLKDYRSNMLEMIHLARGHGTHVVLLYNELWENGIYLHILQEISKSERVPLVDGNAIIRSARERVEEQMERRFGLAPASEGSSNSNEVEVIFRLYSGDYRVPRAMYIVGAHPAVGNLTPNQVAMYDDGTHGDERAGDSVWTYSAKLPRAVKVFYVYTNSGREGRWEGLDVPHIRQFEVIPGSNVSKIYRPIETFGKIYLQADSWHTDAAGYDLIAQGVLDALTHDNKFSQYLQRGQTTVSVNASTSEKH